jgi:hypothetical protein
MRISLGSRQPSMMTPADNSGREHSDAITDALRALSKEQGSLVGAAFAIGASSGCRWRDRYGAADRARFVRARARSSAADAQVVRPKHELSSEA